MDNHSAVLDLDSSRLTITRTSSPKPVPAQNSLESWSLKCSTDHMLMVRWTDSAGWEEPQIRPFGPLEIMPTASCLHYATECFEGLKAYRGVDEKVRLFRPDRNAKRFLASASRISLPGFSIEQFLMLLKKLVGLEAARWIPSSGRFMYIRPSIIGTGSALGISRPKEALMFIVMSIFPSPDQPPPGQEAIEFKGMRLLTSRKDAVRAWPGGFGSVKVGGNYGPTILAHDEALRLGYHQILWLHGEQGYVTEAGASNFFVLWRARETGRLELVTAPLDNGIILEGVTRATVIDFVREHMQEITVAEREFTVQEMMQADEEGRLLEAFVTGTAYFVIPCGEIHFRGVDLLLPLGKEGETSMGRTARYTTSIKDAMKDIMFGKRASD